MEVTFKEVLEYAINETPFDKKDRFTDLQDLITKEINALIRKMKSDTSFSLICACMHLVDRYNLTFETSSELIKTCRGNRYSYRDGLYAFLSLNLREITHLCLSINSLLSLSLVFPKESH